MYDIGADRRRDDALAVCAVVPTVLTALYRLGIGLEPVEPRDDLPFSANYLYMLTGEEPDAARASAVERYLISTVDHGFNASTFTARVIASTGADIAACLVGAVGALSGPLHGGAPSRALDTLDAIGSPDRIDAWIRERVLAGERIMGFGHPVYRTEDPRSRMLRSIAQGFGGPLADFAVEVEQRVEAILAELKPGRELHTNVEFYAGVVMELCGLPREMFTPTFCAARMVGWSANILEQAQDPKIIRPHGPLCRNAADALRTGAPADPGRHQLTPPHTSQIPVVVPAGFLGSGKTTLLNHLLRNRSGNRIGVIVNDFGSIEIDAMTVAGQVGSTVSLGNGCLCCAVDASELDTFLETLTRPSARLDVIVIEASGLAEPQELVRMLLASDNPHIRYGGLVEVVDAAEFPATRARHPEIDRHLAVADLIVLNKTDRVTEAGLSEVRRAVGEAAWARLR